MALTLIAAVARNGVIGDGRRLPWHLPEDLTHFKATTMGATLLLGRRTFESLGRALPGRRHVVLTRDPTWHREGAEVAASFEEALALAGPGPVFVAGGGEVYREALPYAQRLVITHVERDAEGSVTFPDIDPARWEPVSQRPGPGFTIVEYARRPAQAS